MEEMKLIVYVQRDIIGSIVQINSNVFINDLIGWEQIDEWSEGQDRYLYSHASNGEYVLEKHGKTLFDEQGRPNFHDNFVAWTEEEKKVKYPAPNPQPTPQEEQMEFNVDTDYRLSMLELGLV